MLNIGRGSATAGDVVVTTNAWSSLSAISALATNADAAIIDLTINDAAANTNVTTYKANIQAIINALLAASSGMTIILMTGNPTNPAIDNATNQANFRQYYKDLALLNDLPLIDQWVIYTDYATMVSNNLMFNSRHPNTAGYASLGAYVGDTLKQWTA